MEEQGKQIQTNTSKVSRFHETIFAIVLLGLTGHWGYEPGIINTSIKHLSITVRNTVSLSVINWWK